MFLLNLELRFLLGAPSNDMPYHSAPSTDCIKISSLFHIRYHLMINEILSVGGFLYISDSLCL